MYPELWLGIDQHLEQHQSRYNELVAQINAAVAEQAEAGQVLTQCASEKIELSRR